jgi:hypothetical protein
MTQFERLATASCLLEALFPARTLPQVKGWKTWALVVFVLYFYLSSYLPLLWGDTLARYRSWPPSSTRTSARRNGWDTSCSGRRVTAFITRAAFIITTIPICRCSTSLRLGRE